MWMLRVANSTPMVDDDGEEVEAEDTRLARSSEGKGGEEGWRRRVEVRREGSRRRRVEAEGLLMRSRRPRRLLL